MKTAQGHKAQGKTTVPERTRDTSGTRNHSLEETEVPMKSFFHDEYQGASIPFSQGI